MIVPPYSRSHSQTRSTNASRPSSWRDVPCSRELLLDRRSASRCPRGRSPAGRARSKPRIRCQRARARRRARAGARGPVCSVAGHVRRRVRDRRTSRAPDRARRCRGPPPPRCCCQRSSTPCGLVERLHSGKFTKTCASSFTPSDVFFDQLAAVGWTALAIALGLHFAEDLIPRTIAWRNILVASYPEEPIRAGRRCPGLTSRGVGVNSIVPGRGGDLVKLYLVRREACPATTYTTLGLDARHRDAARPGPGRRCSSSGR